MPLVTANQFQLTPDILGSLSRGMGVGDQFRRQQMRRAQQEFLQGGGLQQEDALQRAAEIGGIQFQQQIAQGLGLMDARTDQINQKRLNEAADFAFKTQNMPLEQQNIAIQRRVEFLESQGRDASQTRELLQMPEDQRQQAFQAVQLAALPNATRMDILMGKKGLSAGMQEFQSLTSGLSPEDVERAKRIKLGLEGREVADIGQVIMIAGVPHIFDRKTSSMKRVTISDDGQVVTGETVAATKGQIKEAEELAKGRAATTTSAIDKGIETMSKIDGNINNIGRAISAIDRGAKTGVIESRFFPSVKAASVELDQIQGELALDVVGATTFGALSKGELDLAKEVALPTGLNETELKEFLVRKQQAQQKLRSYFQEQIDFLDQGGTVPGFLRMKQQQAQGGQPAQAQPQQAAPVGDTPLTPEEQAELEQLRQRFRGQ